ncbi:unnamed protein product [Meganyctiphanes norvegica]|uniref:Peroxidase n=1 Tax=Meganyctiphanes norvegica TaxID=48144 RepID=A0AAV2QV58_MEGNR
MLKMHWFFNLVFLGTTWSIVPMVKASESISLPSMELIESVMRSSFENASRINLLGGESRYQFADGMPQEDMSYLQHGSHAPNADSWKLTCVWEAMSNAARHLPLVLPETDKSDISRSLDEMRTVCSSLASSRCGVDFDEVKCNPYDEYRTIDGTCNNLQHTKWGSAPQPFERYLPAEYGDGKMSFRIARSGGKLPEPRHISQMLSNSVQRDTPKVTLMVMQWGQFIDHDVTLTPERELHEEVDGSKTLMCCDNGQYSDSQSLGEDCVPIDVYGDSYYRQDHRQCIRFVRSMPATKGCSYTPMEQINQNTAFVDGSQVYGSEKEVADFVRTKWLGLLNTTSHPGNRQPLPPRGGEGHDHRCPLPESMGDCFLAGDVRVDEMPGLTAMHTAFIRLHNLITLGLSSINRQWNDEKLFQETRRIVSALIQQITYRDWLPHVLGPTLMKQLDLNTGKQGYKDTYNPSVDPTIRNVFSTAAFRFGHTLLTDFVKGATEQMDLPLPGNFFNISVVESDGTSPSSMLKGLSRCPSEPIDGFVADTFTKTLFATQPNKQGLFFGLDLVSLNIQRGRDHGIPSYRKWRQFCGLRDIKSFNRLKKVMERNLAKDFSRLYEHIDDVDIFPAGLSEFPGDGLLGPTFSCILARNFAQMKHGDRFWYERENQPKPFTTAQLSSIRSQSLVSVLCKVSAHTKFGFQPDPFLVPGYHGNAVMDCSNYHFIDLNPWKETPTYSTTYPSWRKSSSSSSSFYSNNDNWGHSWWYKTTI